MILAQGLDTRFCDVSHRATGGFGSVLVGKDTKHGNRMTALKHTKINESGISSDAWREVLYMRAFRHDNVMTLIDCGVYGNSIVLFMEYSDEDLSTFWRRQPEIGVEKRKRIISHISNGILYMHSQHVCHRDLKCTNVLVNRGTVFKVCDFGSSRHMSVENGRCLSHVPTTMWMRAPETLIGANDDYTYSIDVWAIGCMWLELILRNSPFPGRVDSEYDQLIYIMKICGTPTPSTWPGIYMLPRYATYWPSFKSKLKSLIPDDSEYAILERALCLYPCDRISPRKLVSELHDDAKPSKFGKQTAMQKLFLGPGSDHPDHPDTRSFQTPRTQFDNAQRSLMVSDFIISTRSMNISISTVYIAVRLIDCYLFEFPNVPNVSRAPISLVPWCALSVASKVNCCEMFSAGYWIDMADEACDLEQFYEIEEELLKSSSTKLDVFMVPNVCFVEDETVRLEAQMYYEHAIVHEPPSPDTAEICIGLAMRGGEDVTGSPQSSHIYDLVQSDDPWFLALRGSPQSSHIHDLVQSDDPGFLALRCRKRKHAFPGR